MHLLREALHVLMEGVPAAIRLEEVEHALARLPGVRSVHDLHVWNISSGRVALSAHMELSGLECWPQVLAVRKLLRPRDRACLPAAGTGWCGRQLDRSGEAVLAA
jgi:cobalt-zinc-cadmium efflux system protein